MILKFPDLNTLRLALITGAVPPNMAQAGAVAGFDDQDQCWVETSATPAKNSPVSRPRASELSASQTTLGTGCQAQNWSTSTRLLSST